MKPTIRICLGIAGVVLGASSLLGASEVPTTVSPGTLEGFSVIGTRCPTFSWAGGDGTQGYELLVYEIQFTEETAGVADGESTEQFLPVIRQSLPIQAYSWTPPLDLCLKSGGQYAWTVRSLEAPEPPGEWSETRLFEVGGQPTITEVETALQVLRQYLAISVEEDVTESLKPQVVEDPEALPVELPGPQEEAVPLAGQALTFPGAAAIRGEQTDATGEAYGIHGISDSGDGMSTGIVGQSTATSGGTRGVVGQVQSINGIAGLFENTEGGQILGGWNDGTEVFSVEGDGQVIASGDVTALGFVGDGSLLGNVIAQDLNCTGCISESELEFDPTTQVEFNSHASNSSAHHVPTFDTNCDGQACDGTNFANLQWASIVNRPAGLDDGDDDTTYAAGPGLVLTGTQFSLGSFSAPPMDNQISTVASANSGGSYTSITVGADGLPVISYFTSGQNLLVAKCNDPACSGGDELITMIDGLGQVGRDNSIVVGADGLPVISYLDIGNGALKVAKCVDINCSSASLATVDDNDSVGVSSSITIGVDGLPVISYGDATNFDLKVAKCNDSACAGGDETITAVDSVGDVGLNSSISIGADGLPVISYYDHGIRVLKAAKCNDAACSGGDELISTVDNSYNNGQSSSLTIGFDGLPVISYRSSGSTSLKVAKCNDPACAGGDETITTVDSEVGSGVGSFNSITMGPDGLPVISYIGPNTGSLRVAKCNDAACSGGDEAITDVDGVGPVTVGQYSSITIGADGLPVISYEDTTNGTLKVAKCASEFCIPFFRRR